MTEEYLNDAQKAIVAVTGLVNAHNHNFFGDIADENLFARFIRGKLRHWGIWESETHVAILTPLGNTPGYTVLVSRSHLPSDVMGLNSLDFQAFAVAAFEVGQNLKRAYGVARCGMFFKGYEISYTQCYIGTCTRRETTL